MKGTARNHRIERREMGIRYEPRLRGRKYHKHTDEPRNEAGQSGRGTERNKRVDAKLTPNSHPMKNYMFHISGTHCNACKMLIEDVLSEEKDIQNAQVNLESQTLALDSENTDANGLLSSLNQSLKPFGYEVSAMEK